ncbi:MAG: hypothetical protein Q7R75_02195 [bacterium]|nr:hypothetical protein [bacterium]
MPYSILIKNGTIIDGTGNKAYKGDVGIEKDTITKIAPAISEKAELVIDASGKFVSPGFIDLTTHSDIHWTLFSEPSQESFLRQGITTIIGGHGGFSLAPLLNPDVLESLNKKTLAGKSNINWQTFEEFFTELQKHNFGVNFATFVGFENLRRNILGATTRKANKKEVRSMTVLLESSIKSGAFGLSTNLSSASSGLAEKDEIIELFRTVKKYNALTSHHLEDEGKNLLPSLSRLIMLARASGAKCHISHFKALGRTAWTNFENALNMIELARKDGVNITCDFFPYTATGSNLLSLLPPWILTENKENILKLLKNRKTRLDLIEYIKNLTLHYDKIIISSTLHDTGSVGKSIQKLSQTSGIKEEEILLELLKINELEVSIFNEAISKEHLEILAKKPYVLCSSDGIGYELSAMETNQLKRNLPHPRSFGSFPKFIKNFSAEKQLISMEEAVYKSSGLPAKILGMKRRGVIEKNNFADIAVINLEILKDNSTYDNPFEYASGIEHVIVNGVLEIYENKLKNTNGGKIIKKEQ